VLYFTDTLRPHPPITASPTKPIPPNLLARIQISSFPVRLPDPSSILPSPSPPLEHPPIFPTPVLDPIALPQSDPPLFPLQNPLLTSPHARARNDTTIIIGEIYLRLDNKPLALPATTEPKQLLSNPLASSPPPSRSSFILIKPTSFISFLRLATSPHPVRFHHHATSRRYLSASLACIITPCPFFSSTLHFVIYLLLLSIRSRLRSYSAVFPFELYDDKISLTLTKKGTGSGCQP
jgi:hypothetical protein